MTHTYVIGLGSNLGNRLDFLEKAIYFASAELGNILLLSEVYESSPWGIERNSQNFLNQVAVFQSELEPLDFLLGLQEIETRLGRTREVHFGDRTIDLDILFCDDLILSHPKLEIPHPSIAQRNFVLVPMAEILPDFMHPILGLSMEVLLENCTDTGTIQKYQN